MAKKLIYKKEQVNIRKKEQANIRKKEQVGETNIIKKDNKYNIIYSAHETYSAKEVLLLGTENKAETYIDIVDYRKMA